ncbi:hypothetical protein DSUL_50281 [Desulfovibrionales bacterium]
MAFMHGLPDPDGNLKIMVCPRKLGN